MQVITFRCECPRLCDLAMSFTLQVLAVSEDPSFQDNKQGAQGPQPKRLPRKPEPYAGSVLVKAKVRAAKAPISPTGSKPLATFFGVGEEGIGDQPPTLKGVKRGEPQWVGRIISSMRFPSTLTV